MKTFITIVIVTFFSFNGMTQCNDQLLSMAVNQLPEGFNYVKDIKVRMKKSKKKGPPISMKQGIVLNKGQVYKFYARNAKEYDGKIIFQLQNNRGVMGASYSNGRHYTKGFSYKCNATGMYYLTSFYENGLEGCSIIIVAVKPIKNELDNFLD